MEVSAEMLHAKETLAAVLAAALPFLPGVLGVDVGLRQEGAELTDELVIRVLVDDAAAVAGELGQFLGGIDFPVSIVERELTPLVDDGVYAPLLGGITIRAAHGLLLIPHGAGTLGGFAADTMFGGRVGVTCAHVIAESHQAGVMQGDPIFQPGTNRQVGRLFRWQASTDTAVFALDNGFGADTSIAEIGPVSGMARAKVGDLVRKRGRTTTLTLGVVSAIGLAPLGRGTPANSFEIYARDVSTAPIFCKPGDSGSLIVNEDDHVVGILTQKGIEYSRLVTFGSPPDGAVSGFATQMVTDGALIGAADSVGISF
ncbi:trypsin-like peptidase domain-containing protein [Mycolicibacterium litorale]|uniref:trypsin-like peptidase domain-containing protein n=1 Tax=Mycolicibacterium litorale TaxID=758802 RepID=UPI003CEDB801